MKHALIVARGGRYYRGYHASRTSFRTRNDGIVYEWTDEMGSAKQFPDHDAVKKELRGGMRGAEVYTVTLTTLYKVRSDREGEFRIDSVSIPEQGVEGYMAKYHYSRTPEQAVEAAIKRRSEGIEREHQRLIGLTEAIRAAHDKRIAELNAEIQRLYSAPPALQEEKV